MSKQCLIKNVSYVSMQILSNNGKVLQLTIIQNFWSASQWQPGAGKNMSLPFLPTHITNPDLTTQPFKSREKGGLVQCSQLVNHHSIRALNHEHDIKMSITNAIIYNHRNQFGLINANYYMHIHAMFAMLSISSILPITGSFPKQSWQSEMHDKVVYILA